jgi:hypothetical protein
MPKAASSRHSAAAGAAAASRKKTKGAMPHGFSKRTFDIIVSKTAFKAGEIPAKSSDSVLAFSITGRSPGTASSKAVTRALRLWGITSAASLKAAKEYFVAVTDGSGRVTQAYSARRVKIARSRLTDIMVERGITSENHLTSLTVSGGKVTKSKKSKKSSKTRVASADGGATKKKAKKAKKVKKAAAPAPKVPKKAKSGVKKAKSATKKATKGKKKAVSNNKKKAAALKSALKK